MPSLAPAGFSTLLREISHSASAMPLSTLEFLGIFGAMLSARRYFRGGRRLPKVDGELRPLPHDYYFNPELYADRALHPKALEVAGALSYEEIVCSRRKNYERFAGLLDGIQRMKPLFLQLPEGICPLSFPLAVSNRNACVETLHARGIAACSWWAGFHRNGIDWSQFTDASWLKQNLLTLPTHHFMNDRHLKYVANTVALLSQCTDIGIRKNRGSQHVGQLAQ